MALFGSAELYLPLGGLIDKDARKKDLATKIEKLAAQIGSLEKRLGNDGFVKGAPAEVVASERERLARLKDESAKLEQARAALG
jgi:valyl-tRNA synthetase